MMGGQYFQRTLQSALSLAGLVVLVFFLARMTGNAADLYLPVDATPQIREEFMRLHGLDAPLLVQFGRYIADLASFDLGQSLRVGRPAFDLVVEAFPTTLMLAVSAVGIALAIGVVVGSLAAFRPNGLFDRLATIMSLVASSIPGFWLAIVGILVFAVQLRLVPTAGNETAVQWILPVFVLTVRPCGLIVQVVRGSMLTALSSPYVKTAKAKGVRNRTIIFVHALRNAMLPVITVVGDEAAGIINGAVVVEMIFNFPGVGRLLIEAIYNRDFAVIQATVMVTAVSIFLLNLIIDLAYVMLDPRIRYSS